MLTPALLTRGQSANLRTIHRSQFSVALLRFIRFLPTGVPATLGTSPMEIRRLKIQKPALGTV